MMVPVITVHLLICLNSIIVALIFKVTKFDSVFYSVLQGIFLIHKTNFSRYGNNSEGAEEGLIQGMYKTIHLPIMVVHYCMPA